MRSASAAFATKGYEALQRNRRGRQLGRVLATAYQEVVVDRLFDGKTQLTRALQPLVLAAEETLHLDEDKRRRTIVRLDAGGGSLDDVNWKLSRGYQVHGKDYSGQQAKRLASSVADWYVDPHLPERQFGWVTEAAAVGNLMGVRLRPADLHVVGSARPRVDRAASLVASGSGSGAAGVR